MNYIKRHALARAGIYFTIGVFLTVVGYLTRKWRLPDWYDDISLKTIFYAPLLVIGSAVIVMAILTAIFSRVLDKHPHALTSYVSILTSLQFTAILTYIAFGIGFKRAEETVGDVLISALPGVGLFLFLSSGLFFWYWFRRAKEFSFWLVLYDFLTIVFLIPVGYMLVILLFSGSPLS